MTLAPTPSVDASPTPPARPNKGGSGGGGGGGAKASTIVFGIAAVIALAGIVYLLYRRARNAGPAYQVVSGRNPVDRDGDQGEDWGEVNEGDDDDDDQLIADIGTVTESTGGNGKVAAVSNEAFGGVDDLYATVEPDLVGEDGHGGGEESGYMTVHPPEDDLFSVDPKAEA